MATMSDASLSYHQKLLEWMGVLHIPGVGPTTFWKMLKATSRLPGVPGMQDIFDKHECAGITILPAFDERFPTRLKQLHDCPPIIYIKGDPSLLSSSLIAIVGARNPSISAKKWSENLAKHLLQDGWGVVSGMARGIDGSAHLGSLSKSCAILAGGVDQIYPKEHKGLYETLCKQGCVMSEDPIGTSPSAPLFPRRNRMIAALAQGIIVVEAAKQSGSLITCRLGLELGRDIFSVPGPPWDLKSQGNLQLLREGAHLCESIEDIRSQMGVIERPFPPQLSEESCESDSFPTQASLNIYLPLSSQALLGLIGSAPTPIHEILSHFHSHNAQGVIQMLSEMEIEGQLKRCPDGSLMKGMS